MSALINTLAWIFNVLAVFSESFFLSETAVGRHAAPLGHIILI
jgi:hypothetical protein